MTSTRNPPTMVKTALQQITFASDLTARGDRALDRSLMLARTHLAALSAVHVIDSILLPEKLLPRELREAKARLQQEMLEAGTENIRPVSVRALTGEVPEAIVRYASATRSDLIVMGSADYSKLGAAFRGTTIDRVVRIADCPVLAVKTRPRHEYDAIVIAVDQGPASQQALVLALNVFPRARVTVIHVDEPVAGQRVNIEVRKEVEEIVRLACATAKRPLPGNSKGPTIVVKRGRALDVLPDAIVRHRPDLVVLGTHGRRGIAKLILGSVAEALLGALPFDVLVTRGHRRGG